MNITAPFKATDNPGNGASAKLDQIRQSLSEQAESLADVAANYGSEAGAKASKIADETGQVASDVTRDAVGSLSSIFQSLLDSVASLIASLTAGGRKAAADIGHDAQSAASELRKVRITTEPKKTGPDFMPGITLLGGFGAGVALMYFFDPEQGKRRRALLRDQVTKWTRVTGEQVQGRTKDLSNRAQGAAVEARKALQGVMPTTEGTADAWGETQQRGLGAGDPSTTDTWGEQPQTSDSQRIEVS